MKTPVLALAFRLLMLSCTVMLAGPAPAAGPAPERSAYRFEVQYLTGMIDHHAMAVEMAELCEGKVVHPELEALCRSIVEKQMMEIQTMQSWLADWYGIDYEPTMNPGAHRAMEKLAALSGEEFEIAFMEMMIRHHAKAIIESRHCERRAFHAELQEFCTSIIVSQSEEIEIMEGWLCDWYDQC